MSATGKTEKTQHLKTVDFKQCLRYNDIERRKLKTKNPKKVFC